MVCCWFFFLFEFIFIVVRCVIILTVFACYRYAIEFLLIVAVFSSDLLGVGVKVGEFRIRMI